MTFHHCQQWLEANHRISRLCQVQSYQSSAPITHKLQPLVFCSLEMDVYPNLAVFCRGSSMEGRQGTEKGAANKSSNVVKNLFGVLFVCLPDTKGIKIPNIFFPHFLIFTPLKHFFSIWRILVPFSIPSAMLSCDFTLEVQRNEVVSFWQCTELDADKVGMNHSNVLMQRLAKCHLWHLPGFIYSHGYPWISVCCVESECSGKVSIHKISAFSFFYPFKVLTQKNSEVSESQYLRCKQ